MNWNLVWVQWEHHKDLLREAEQERLARLALAARQNDSDRSVGLLSRVLGWLGRQLVHWGEWLQRHSGYYAPRSGEPDLEAPHAQLL